MKNKETTITAFIGALIMAVTFVLIQFFNVIIPDNIVNSINVVVIGLIALFVDPKTIISVSDNIAGKILGVINILFFIASAIFKQEFPITFQLAIQTILLFLWGWFDTKKAITP
jgi:hypothetical protein